MGFGAGRTRLAIDMGRRLLRAVEVRSGRGRIEILRAISVETPASLETDNAEATGRWVAEALAAARIGTRVGVFDSGPSAMNAK